MEYIRLPYTTNPYPQPGNYITKSPGRVSLYGIYDRINKVDFDLENLNNVTKVDKTNFRFILAVKKTSQDTKPKYFTSDVYYRDLEAALVDSNPYFIKASFDKNNIVEVNLENSIQLFKQVKLSELNMNINTLKNNFILSNSKITGVVNDTNPNFFNRKTKLENTQQDVESINSELSKLSSKISKLRYASASQNFENTSKDPFRLFKKIQLKIDDEVITPDINPNDSGNKLVGTEAEIYQKNSILFKINAKIKSAEQQEVDLLKKRDNIVGAFKTLLKSERTSPIKNILENYSDDISIDYIQLVKYIDWIVSSQKLDELDNNGVIPSTELIQYDIEKEVILPDDSNTIPTPTPTPNKVYEYQVVRNSINTPFEQSTITFTNSLKQVQTIQTSNYGVVGRYCMEENSWAGSVELYSIIQIGECGADNSKIPLPPNGEGYRGGRGGGPNREPVNNESDWWRYPGSGLEANNYNRDFENVR
jgi:hypothetical protein